MTLKRLPTLLLAGTTALALSAGLYFQAHAGNRSYAAMQNVQSTDGITIQSPGQGTTNRSIVVPYSKSTVIELPENVMDVIVSNPDIVEAMVHTSRRVVLIGKEAGQTNVFFYGHGGNELLNIDIRVEKDINGLSDLIRQNAPSANVNVQGINDKILLTGSVPNAATADMIEKLARMWSYSASSGGFFRRSSGGTSEDIVNLLTIEGKDQVMLKVRIVEMQRSVTKQLGINLGLDGAIGDTTFSVLNDVNSDVAGGLTGAFNFLNSAGGSLRSLSTSLQALERVGLVRTLAEPTLTAISGETANFLSGGELPILTGVSIDARTGQLVREFEFKPYGVSLGFTPVVLSEGLISLNISTEVSEPTVENAFETDGAGDILGIRVRRANTVVELPAGGSMVIAGLIREEARTAVEGVPGAKDLPGIGAFFRSRDSQTVQTELVVIVTPYLVDPTHPDKLQTPIDGFVPENDLDNLLLGRINKTYAGNGQPKISTDSLSGPFGHVVD
ncbi:type II and III secretion system protein family protein [Litorimonas sp. RW-G-Af-16]|uniref:type II and III secretion system protein family protein n=1 Tax=Litorimonas sp. RW-G-Af-16 TaxID=3241168 RepID=UPI00390C87F4